MAVPYILRSLIRREAITIGALVGCLACLGFLAGRWSVHETWIEKSPPALQSERMRQPARDEASETPDYSKVTIQNIATVPFSQLFDILRAAPREQRLTWARDLEQMPRGPRQRAAVSVYYKSLIQVDHRVAIEAVLHAENLYARDTAIDAMMKAAPESTWPDLAEMTAQMRYPSRGYSQDELISNWSRVDPVAASQFVEKHRFSAGVKLPGDEYDRVVSLLSNWGEIDPKAAREWLEADASRQTADAYRALLTAWGRLDRGGAIDYAVKNVQEPQVENAINELVYEFVRSAKEDATRLILRLPSDRARAALRNVADITNPEVIDPNLGRPPDYQRPPDDVARWMASLPIELWKESIGVVAQEWLSHDTDSAVQWFNHLPPEVREVAIVSLCSARQSSSREDVIKLAWTIRDPELREEALGKVARSLRIGRDDAVAAIDDLTLSNEQKAYLRKIVPEDGDGQ